MIFNFLYLFIRLGSKLIYVRQSPVFLDKEVQMHNKKWYCMIVYFLCVDSWGWRSFLRNICKLVKKMGCLSSVHKAIPFNYYIQTLKTMKILYHTVRVAHRYYSSSLDSIKFILSFTCIISWEWSMVQTPIKWGMLFGNWSGEVGKGHIRRNDSIEKGLVFLKQRCHCSWTKHHEKYSWFLKCLSASS